MLGVKQQKFVLVIGAVFGEILPYYAWDLCGKGACRCLLILIMISQRDEPVIPNGKYIDLGLAFANSATKNDDANAVNADYMKIRKVFLFDKVGRRLEKYSYRGVDFI